MKKGINAWCFDKNLPLDEIFRLAYAAGYDGIELNMSEMPKYEGVAAEHGLSSVLELTIDVNDKRYESIRDLSEKYGVEISSFSTALHWSYPLTDNDPEVREKGEMIVKRMIDAAEFFGCDTVLVVPGLVTKQVSYDKAYERAFAALKSLSSYAEEKKVIIGIENVWNKFLLSPLEVKNFIDGIGSDYVGVYFDAGNIMQYGFPEQWVSILGKRIARVHVKDFDTSVGNASGFRKLLDGSVDWQAFMSALKNIGYDSYITAELSPYKTNPNQLIEDTGRALDYILGL